MVESDDTSKDYAHDRALLEDMFKRLNNPQSVRERIQFYIDSAKARLQVAVRDSENEPDYEALFKQLLIESDKSAKRKILRKIKIVNAPGDLQAMIREANTALKLFEVGDIDRALIAYDHMHAHREKCNLPVNKSNEQSEFAKSSRRPQLPTRAILCAFRAGYQSKSDVENFLLNESSLSDEWGKFEIETVQVGFELTDPDRHFKVRTLKTARLSSQISEIKKRYND
jgi:hypothetical protein